MDFAVAGEEKEFILICVSETFRLKIILTFELIQLCTTIVDLKKMYFNETCADTSHFHSIVLILC